MDVMTTNLALAAYLVPLSLVGVALWGLLMPSPRVLFQMGRRATAMGAFLGSLLAGAAVFQYGSLVTPLVGFGEIGLVLRLDALSVFIFWLAAFLGILIIRLRYKKMPHHLC